MKTVLAHRLRFQSWAGILATALMVSYLALMGEAIHCEYFAQEQEGHHHGSSSTPINRAANCLIANHCAAAVIHSFVSPSHLPPQLLGLILIPDPKFARTDLDLSKSARAPPSV